MSDVQTVREVIDGIEARVKPSMRGKDQTLGFCTALSAVLEAFGPNTVVGDGALGAAAGETIAVERYVCPDCGGDLRKRRAQTEAGEVRVAWICDCDPDALASAAGEAIEDL